MAELIRPIGNIVTKQLIISDYFNSIINLIDIDTEELLNRIQIENKHQDLEENVEILNKNRSILIDKVNQICRLNLDSPSVFGDQDNEEQIRSELFKKSCFFIDHKQLKNYLYDGKTNGILVITDFNVTDQDIESFRNIFVFLDHFQSKKSSIPKVSIRDILIVERIIESLKSCKDIIEIEKIEFDAVVEAKINHFSSTDYLDMINIDFSDLKNLKSLKIRSEHELKLKQFSNPNIEYLKFFAIRYQIDEIRIMAKGLEEIDRTCLNYPNLKVLDLSGNGMASFKPGIFDNLPSLEEIDLSNNNLYFLDGFLFSKCYSLKVIDLYGNHLNRINENCFSGVEKLEKLLITVVTKEIFIRDSILKALRNLKYLELNPLGLDCDTIKTLCRYIPELKALSVHIKNMNCIDIIIDGFKCLDKLVLVFKEDKYSLEINNRSEPHDTVNKIDEEFKELKIQSNKSDLIKKLHLHPRIRAHYSLHDLILTKFSYSEGYFDKSYSKLEKLNFDFTRLAVPNENTFHNLVALKWLSLENIDLKSIRGNLFSKLTNLEYLSLRGNKIRQIEAGAFDALVNLKELDLNYGIKYPIKNEKLLRNLKKLEILSMCQVNFESMENIFDGLLSLRNIEMEYEQVKPLAYEKIKEISDFCTIEIKIGLDFDLEELKPLKMFINSKRIRLSWSHIQGFNRYDFFTNVTEEENPYKYFFFPTI